SCCPGRCCWSGYGATTSRSPATRWTPSSAICGASWRRRASRACCTPCAAWGSSCAPRCDEPVDPAAMRLSTRFAVFFAALVPVRVLLSGVLMVALIHRDLGVERDRQLVVRLNALKPLASAYAWRTRLLPVLPAQSLRRRLADGAEGPGGMRLEIPGADPLIIGDVPDALPPPGVDGPADIDEGGRVWR